jgi:Domain of unknown function (DUF4276)
MIRVHIFCEGQTEYTFVKRVLFSYFIELDILLNPFILSNGSQKGGTSTYGKVKSQVERKCKEDPTAWVTTLIDFYGLPSDFPSSKLINGLSSIERAKVIEREFQKDIAQPNFIAHIIVHEFESLLFSQPEAFRIWFDDERIINKLIKIRSEFESPEHINSGYTTAPSRRISQICNKYEKITDGLNIALDIGLETIRRECPIFNSWIESLERLV